MDYQNINNEKPNTTKKSNKKVIIIAGIAIAFAIIIILIASISSIHRTPNEQQLQADLIQQKLKYDDLSISDFTVYSEEEIDNKYTAIVSVTYEKAFVEYDEKYTLTYSKYDDWVFYDVEAYDKNLWTKKPTALPNVDEYTKSYLEELKNTNDGNEYDSFLFNESKSSSDLEAGKVTYVFDVKKETAIKSMSGEKDFSIEFDFDKGEWNLQEVSNSDSYEIEYNFLRSWIGTLECEIQHSWYDTDDRKSKLSITEFESVEKDIYGTIKGQFVFGNKTYDMSGSISLSDAYSVSDSYMITMTSSTEKVCRLEGTLHSDGSLSIKINRDYTGRDDSSFYYYNTYDIFTGEMKMQ